MNECAPRECAGCPSHHAGNLVRLGVDMDNFDYVVALAGNPNTGKSTVFNDLTGLRQHTGNWPGKTVTRAEGGFAFGDGRFKLVDLPGTYSLLSTTVDEEIARNFILFGRPDVTVVVVDANHLERNLHFALQVLEITDRAVVCLNLVDEAKRHGLSIDERRLARDLGVPVVPTVARYGTGIDELIQAIAGVASGQIVCRPHRAKRRKGREENALYELETRILRTMPSLPSAQWVARRLLDGDARIEDALRSGELLELSRHAQRTDASALEKIAPPAGAHPDPERGSDGGSESDRGSGDSVLPDTGRVPSGERGPHFSAEDPAVIDSGGNSPAGSSAHAAGANPRGGALAHAAGEIIDAARSLRWDAGAAFQDAFTRDAYDEAARLSQRATLKDESRARFDIDRMIDNIVTSRVFGVPVMLALLTLVFWLTISGANVPSAALSSLLIDRIHPMLVHLGTIAHFPWWLSGVLFDGCYLSMAWVVAVMLPPMAIFFPLFTLLEDFGYLARVSFNLDGMFRRAGAHGKQALTMSMGFGCNAAGVVATRIIDSRRERLIAIITNNFALCNGRWPTQILIASIFLGVLAPARWAGLVSAGAVVGVAMTGVAMTFVVSWALSRTALHGETSAFSLELPPYRPPRFWTTLYTSLIDRTLFVLWRAVVFALPAGAVIWLSANIVVGHQSVAAHLVNLLNPAGVFLGLNGVILLAYVVAIPANEIVIPTILMLTVMTVGITGVGHGAGVMFDLKSSGDVAALLHAGGWTVLTGVNLMLFSLLHNPCSTTIFTIWKETGSRKWTTVSTLLPLVIGVVVCFLVAQVWRLVVAG